MPRVGKKKRGGKMKQSEPKMPAFKPEWVEAFMIMMLHKIGGSQTLTVEMLEAFSKASHGKKTQFSYDAETNSITITAPDYEMPVKGPKIIRPNLKIVNSN